MVALGRPRAGMLPVSGSSPLRSPMFGHPGTEAHRRARLSDLNFAVHFRNGLCSLMIWIQAALWGLFGSFAVEGLDLYSAVRRHGCWPWRVHGPREVGAAGYVVAELFRLVIGSGLAWAAAESGQITTSVGALAVGVAAPLILERLARSIPLSLMTDSGHGTASGGEESVFSPIAQQQPSDLRTAEVNGQRVPVEEPRAYADKAEKSARPGERPDQAGG
jgi:hypothetical protein